MNSNNNAKLNVKSKNNNNMLIKTSNSENFENK